MKATNIHLRALEPEDIGFLYRWENDQMVWSVSNTVMPYSRYILKRYIENSHIDIYESRQQRFVIVHSQTNIPVGAIDLFDFDPLNRRVGVGILVYNEKDRGLGFASEALLILKNYCFEILGIHQMYCDVAADNKASIALFAKAGFTEIGLKKDWLFRDGVYKDEIMLQYINK